MAPVAAGTISDELIHFLTETEAHTRGFLATNKTDTITEVFRYQSLITPRWGQSQPIIGEFTHDWPTYVAAGGTGAPLLQRATAVRYIPPAFTSVANFATFASTHFGCIRGRLDSGTIEHLVTHELIAIS